MTDYIEFEGNCPENVSEDAKYAVRSDREHEEDVVALLYVADNGEKWHAVSGNHSELVDMVNAVKTSETYTRRGSFYINEYNQVLVPTADDSNTYYLAGEYDGELEFKFEGKTLSGEATDLDGNPLDPGDEWDGPHPGIPYVLKPQAKDIEYERKIRPRVTKTVKLSDHVGRKNAREVAHRIAEYKGYDGGRFYVNEFGTIFTPQQEGYNLNHIYIGQLDDLPCWFDEPHEDVEL